MSDFKKNFISLSFITAICLITGCENKTNSKHILEFASIEASEEKEAHFFSTDYNFNFSNDTFAQMEKLLRDTRAEGIDNIGFMIISDRIVPFEKQEEIKRKIIPIMNKFGFINSRIIDSGTCVYKEAKSGIRINILKYSVKEPDCSPWSESIGDVDTDKQMPKFGVAGVYNFREMIGNKADLVVPRKYLGQSAKDAIEASKSSGSAGGGGNGSGSSGSSGIRS